jgi:hypothetical protein
MNESKSKQNNCKCDENMGIIVLYIEAMQLQVETEESN